MTQKNIETTQNTSDKKYKLVITLLLVFILFTLSLLPMTAYFAYRYGKSSDKNDNKIVTSTTTLITTTTQDSGETVEGWKIYEEETDYIYLSTWIPYTFTGKNDDMYITISNEDKSIRLYVSGLCDGCTVVPQGPNEDELKDKYTIEAENLIINGDTCKREAYILKENGSYQLYEVTCLEDEEVHIWGECIGDKTKVELCDNISKKMQVENL